MIYFLSHGYTPSYLEPKKMRYLRLKSNQYQSINGVLFHRNYDSFLFNCLEIFESDKVLCDLHDGPVEVEILVVTSLLIKIYMKDITSQPCSRMLRYMPKGARFSRLQLEENKNLLFHSVSRV